MQLLRCSTTTQRSAPNFISSARIITSSVAENKMYLLQALPLKPLSRGKYFNFMLNFEKQTAWPGSSCLLLLHNKNNSEAALNKIVHVSGIRHRRNIRVWHGLEFGEIGLHIFARETNKGSLVAHLVAVVGRTEHRYALTCVRMIK